MGYRHKCVLMPAGHSSVQTGLGAGVGSSGRVRPGLLVMMFPGSDLTADAPSDCFSSAVAEWGGCHRERVAFKGESVYSLTLYRGKRSGSWEETAGTEPRSRAPEAAAVRSSRADVFLAPVL